MYLTKYGYDGVNRLLSFDRGDLNVNKDGISGTAAQEEDWVLDMTGNWDDFTQKSSGSMDLDQDRTHNEVNEITAISETTGTAWADPVHDLVGNATTVPRPSNLAIGVDCKYDAWNRLGGYNSESTMYEYDGLHRRVKRDDEQYGDHFYYNSVWQVLEARHYSSGDPQPETLQPEYQYVWSQRYIDAPVLRDENTDADGTCDDDRIYYLGDANFNVTTLVDSSGDAIERYVYSPYGVLTIYDATWSNIRGASSYDVEYTYTGRRLDAETGLYYYRHRIYAAELGRFLTRDPVGYEDSLSLRQYVRSNPVTLLDPTGEQSLIGCLKSPAALWACVECGVVRIGDVATKYVGKGKGKDLVKLLKKWGGEVVKGGKGSHTKVKMPYTTETVPHTPGKGTVEAILKRAMEHARGGGGTSVAPDCCEILSDID